MFIVLCLDVCGWLFVGCCSLLVGVCWLPFSCFVVFVVMVLFVAFCLFVVFVVLVEVMFVVSGVVCLYCVIVFCS